MNRQNKQSGFAIVELGIVLVVMVLVATVGWILYQRQTKPYKAPDSQSNQSDETSKNSTKNDLETITLNSAPAVSAKYGKDWQQAKEYSYSRDGLTKTLNGRDYIITFKRLDTDYMNRKTGGAYPLGTLYQKITINNQEGYVGITNTPGNAGIVYLSTCPPTSNGSCALPLADGYGYLIVELQIRTSDKWPPETAPLDINSVQDKTIISEFAEIAATIKY